MDFHMVQYTVRPDQVEENERLIRAVFDEMRRSGAAGVRYAAFKLADGVSFVHVVGRDPEHGAPPRLQALKAFHAGLRDRCEIPPTRLPVSEIGAFRAFGDDSL